MDVIVPTIHRDPGWLASAVSSARRCAGVNRVWVVDDGAETPVDAASFQGGGTTEVRVLRRDRSGPSAARNTALVHVQAAALLLDDDDVLIPEGVAAMAALAARTGAMAVVAAREERHPDGRIVFKAVPPEWSEHVLPSPGDVFRPLAIFGASGCLITAAGVATGERFDEGLMVGEDRDFLRRLASHGPIAVSSIPALRVRVHDVARGTSLSTARSYERRVRDHCVLVSRWCDTASEAHFREATRWLIGAVAKSGVSAEAWALLMSLCDQRGWPVPIKARVRWVVRRGRASA